MRMRSPEQRAVRTRAGGIDGDDGQVAACASRAAASLPISVLLPAPGDPVTPITRARRRSRRPRSREDVLDARRCDPRQRLAELPAVDHCAALPRQAGVPEQHDRVVLAEQRRRRVRRRDAGDLDRIADDAQRRRPRSGSPRPFARPRVCAAQARPRSDSTGATTRPSGARRATQCVRGVAREQRGELGQHGSRLRATAPPWSRSARRSATPGGRPRRRTVRQKSSCVMNSVSQPSRVRKSAPARCRDAPNPA